MKTGPGSASFRWSDEPRHRLGEGNAGAIAVRHQAAEGSANEDCAINATHGSTGIQGGSSAGVIIIGGRAGHIELRHRG